MAKLKDDQIRWILSLDAKGVQGELVQVSSEINNLKDANKGLQQEMKAAEKAMNEAASAMARMEESGKTNTKQYQYATESYNSNAAALVELKSKIDQNNKTIEEGKAKFEGLTKTLQVNDMTMNQLRQRAADLQKQMNQTSQNLDKKAYNDLQKQLEQVKGRMFDVEKSGKSLLSQFASMHNPVGSAAKAVQGFGQALEMLKANWLIAIIAAVVAIFYALRDALFKNEEAMNSLNRIMAPFKAIFDGFVNILQIAVGWVLKFIEGIQNVTLAFMKFAEQLPFVGKYIKQLNDEIERGNQLEKEKQNLAKTHRENLVKNAEKENQIAKLRDDAARKDLYSAKEQIEKLQEAIKLEDEIAQSKIEEAKTELHILEIEASRTKNTKELNDKIAEQKALLIGLETEFYNKTRRDQRSISSAIIETQREAADAAKEALQKRLQDEENALNVSINQLKQARLQGVLTEKEYNKQVEQLTIESLNRKINIKGQEKDKILQLEAQILDAQIKQQAEADKELLGELTKAKDNQLALIESARNTQLQQLQDTEIDQKIYALRAAEIEAQTAKAREEIIRAFGKSVEDAEFQNAKIREDAIAASGKEITNAEAKTLQDQANLRKLFAKTTADFERQYNIKTWEQRKADELRILEKQHEAGLLSEETYLLAVQALNKKYEDEKLKIRQQYGISTLKEQYNSELALLDDSHEKGLLSEEEYQKALLEIKLKYAEEYANKAGEFSKVVSDTVKAFSEAETASVSAEYTKRQSALTEQYNQGIISQEEYNTQKEQLDYEEKKKTLDIQKKYADVNFAMQASEIISSGTVAAINAYKALAGIPVVGPALGAAAAALVAVTTAMRLKQAKAERDRVKAMTLESPNGGDSSTPQTGEIRLREGLAEGGYNMADGGYTKQGGKYEVAGYLPVHGGEYVIASDELKQPVIADMARTIERERRKRTNKNSISGMAEGGSNSPEVDSGIAFANSEIMLKILKALNNLEEGNITVQTNYGITEMEAEQKRKMEAESKFTRA